MARQLQTGTLGSVHAGLRLSQCTGNGTRGFGLDTCGSKMKATNNDPRHRTLNRGAEANSVEDLYRVDQTSPKVELVVTAHHRVLGPDQVASLAESLL